MPPPTPTLNRSVTPGWPGVAAPVTAEGGSSGSGGGAAPGARLPARSGQGLIGRDDIGGVGLLGPLLRPQLGLEREGAGGRVEDPAADAAGALAAVAAVAAGGVAAVPPPVPTPPVPPVAAPPAPPRPPKPLAAWLAVNVTVTPVKEAVPALNRPPPLPLPAAPAGAAGAPPPARRRRRPPASRASPRRRRRHRRRHCRRRRPGRRCRRWPDSR